MELLLFVLFFPFMGENESGTGHSYLTFKHAVDEVSPIEAEVMCKRYGGSLPVLKKDSCEEQFQRLALFFPQDISSFWTLEEEGKYYRRLTVSKRSARQCHRNQKMFLQYNSNSYAAELQLDDISYMTVCVLSNTWVFGAAIFIILAVLLFVWVIIAIIRKKLRNRGYTLI